MIRGRGFGDTPSGGKESMDFSIIRRAQKSSTWWREDTN